MTLITFPVIRSTKMPAVKWGHLTVPVEVDPGYDTGIATGARSGIVVLDIDEKKERNGFHNLAKVLGMPDAPKGWPALARLIEAGKLPFTPCVRTPSGGAHLYFAHPGQRVPNSASLIAQGVDVRGDGGYVVAPPSPGYDVLYNQDVPAQCPPWIRVAASTAALPPTHNLHRDDFEALSQRLRKHKNAYEAKLGRALRLAVNGEPFAEPGEIDITLWDLVRIIAREYPMATGESVQAFFAQSLQLMATDARGTDPEYVIEKYDRARDEVANTLALPEVTANERKAVRLSQAKRETPYTPTELDAVTGLPWLVQRGKSYWVLFEGDYVGPFIKDEMAVVCSELLSPAPVVMHNDEGTFKGIETLMIEYGQYVKEHHLSFLAQQTRIEDKKLIQAVAPRPRVEPNADPTIEAWLRLAFGEDFDNVCLWLAHITDLESPSAALVLTGEPSTGKTLFAMCCARVWNRSPVSLTDAMGGFNDILVKSPLVLADEQLPKDFRGYTRSGELREFIQATTRPYRKKYHDTSDIVGAIRLIVTANNLDLFASNEKLSSADVEAIGMRFYHVEINPATKVFLESVNVRAILDAFPAHVAYLESTIDREARRTRFLIQSERNNLHRKLATGTGIRSDICQLLVSYLIDPLPYENTSDLHIRTMGGNLYVNTRGIIDAWRTYIKQDQTRTPPRTDLISTALRGLTHPMRKLLRDRKGIVTQYRQVDVKLLLQWAEDHEFAQVEDLEKALQVASEDRRKSLTH